MPNPHIGIFGRRNYGKSSLLNYLIGQDAAIVSPLPGTTTDPVRKTMELEGVGPVVWVDTAGIDDAGDVGRQRIDRSRQVLGQVDLAILLITNNCFEAEEFTLIEHCRQNQTPYLLVYSQADKMPPQQQLLDAIAADFGQSPVPVSVKDAAYRPILLNLIKEQLQRHTEASKSLLAGLVRPNDIVVLVTPIDESAPKGRLILPQVQVIRELLDCHAQAVICQPHELQRTLQNLLTPPALVITDSQAFEQVAAIVPPQVPLTSFSLILAHAKGPFDAYLQGTPHISHLKDDDNVLILESCTHEVTCHDIGRTQLPQRLAQYTGKQLNIQVVSGLDALPHPITHYQMVIQCGGCVITERQLTSRLQPALTAQIPISNYGLALAYMAGIFDRATEPFRHKISIIVASAQNRAIGRNNDLLWHISDDLKRFKRLTSGHPVIMGRNTYESLPKRPLPNRRNIVVTHDLTFAPQGVEVAHSIQEALQLVSGELNTFVIGGAKLYEQFMPYADKLYVTWVYRDYDADAYFPEIDTTQFRQTSISQRLHDDPSDLDYAFAVYDRMND